MAKAAENEEEERVSLGRWLLDWGLTLGIPVVLALLLHAFVMEPFIVPTGSMLNTIQINDRVWSEKVSYHFHEPAQGDVVLLQSPADPSVTLLKRVVATGGQTIDLVDGQVLIDGEVLDEPYVEGAPTYPYDHFAEGVDPITYPYVVPEGYVWFMGDNRTNSRDSRYYGPVPVSSVFARAFCVYWPLSDLRAL